MQKMSTSFEHMLENASSPEVVAAVVLNAITAENPSLIFSRKGCRNVVRSSKKYV